MITEPSPQSIDFVENKKQFHLYTLLTEQRHINTLDLSSVIRNNIEDGLSMLLSVDEDITIRIKELAEAPAQFEQAAESIFQAIKNGRKIYFYGCGSTGRLAKLMESTFWRPFWKKIRRVPLWNKLKDHIPPDIGERVIGEITGGDRTLISSLEGFEDLRLIGRLQLQDHGIRKGDVVIAVTEGGETSSVIGTILSALSQFGEPGEETHGEASRNLYFVYNNPDHLLLPFHRSRAVLENPGITKINLATGPQAITGSTRMQATTIGTFVLGVVLEEAILGMLRESLNPEELAILGFSPDLSLADRLLTFNQIKESTDRAIDELAGLTRIESETYRNGRFTTYFACEALMTVFTDCTERSPTFGLAPLDTVEQAGRKSWNQVWTKGEKPEQAWRNFLGRDFRGLDESQYRQAFLEEIDDPYLRESALASLKKAGNDQVNHYDLSFSALNQKEHGPQRGDLGVIVCTENEAGEFLNPESGFSRFMSLHRKSGARIAVVSVGSESAPGLGRTQETDVRIILTLPPFPDPLGLRNQIALKMVINAHSTGVMALLGRIIGNTMTHVVPGNLKLIGRATTLILNHVNDAIDNSTWIEQHGMNEPLTFAEANAVLFEAIEYVKKTNGGRTSEVALSIIRILETLKAKKVVGWEEAEVLLDKRGLEGYLCKVTRDA